VSAGAVSTGTRAVPAAATVHRRRYRPRRILLHGFLITVAAVWLFPLLWAVYQSFRPYGETSANPVALPETLTLANYITAWTRAELPKYWLNTAIILLPAVTITLGLASMIAYAVSRFSWRFNLALLMLFTAGNLLPPQVIITPLFRMYLLVPDFLGINDKPYLLYDQHIGIVAILVAFQLGFCTFVLSNYMKTLPKELTEAALVDGASVLRTFWQVILPLCRPPLAALATLEFTWIYNDFFWALLLMPTGAKQPVTSALNNLQGQFFTDTNMLAAGAVMVAIPTLVVYFALQRHFIKGLTLGSTKG
jgi:multiple sugar transport system permease protein